MGRPKPNWKAAVAREPKTEGPRGPHRLGFSHRVGARWSVTTGLIGLATFSFKKQLVIYHNKNIA